MSDIRKLPSGQFEFVVDVTSPDGKRRQVRRRRPTEREARAELRRGSLATDAAGRPSSRSNPLLADFIEQRWLPALEADPKLKPTTVAGYKHMAKHLTAALGQVRLRDLSGDQLTVLYGALRAKGLSERTVRYVHVVAHRALRDAARWRLVAYNAADDAEAPAQTPPNPRAWTPEDVARFLEVAATDRWAALWRVAATTGLRRGELAALQWSDLDGDELVIRRNRVVVDHPVAEGTPKSDRARRIALDPLTVAALQSWRTQQVSERLVLGAYWDAGDHMWTWPDGSLLHPAVITRTFARLVKAADLPTLPLHNLRHAWATSALLAGVDLIVVSTRLGHASTRITQDIYTAAVPSLDEAAALTVADLYDRRGQ